MTDQLQNWGWREMDKNKSNVRSLLNCFHWTNVFQTDLKLISKGIHLNDFISDFEILNKKVFMHNDSNILTDSCPPENWAKITKMDNRYNQCEYVLFIISNGHYLFVHNLEWAESKLSEGCIGTMNKNIYLASSLEDIFLYAIDDRERELLFDFPDMRYLNTIDDVQKLTNHELSKCMDYSILINNFIKNNGHFRDEIIKYILENVVRPDDNQVMLLLNELSYDDRYYLMLNVGLEVADDFIDNKDFKKYMEEAILICIKNDDLKQFNEFNMKYLKYMDSILVNDCLYEAVKYHSKKIIQFILEECDNLKDEDAEYRIQATKNRGKIDLAEMMESIYW